MPGLGLPWDLVETSMAAHSGRECNEPSVAPGIEDMA